MSPRSWHAANEWGSLWARLTINAAAERACPQHLPEGLLPPAGMVLSGTKRPLQPIPWSKREGLIYTALSPWASTPPHPISMGEKGSVLCLALDTVNEGKSDVERGSFQTLSVKGEGRSRVCSTREFSGLVLGAHILCHANPCWFGSGYNSWAKTNMNGLYKLAWGGYIVFSYWNHNRNCDLWFCDLCWAYRSLS